MSPMSKTEGRRTAASAFCLIKVSGMEVLQGKIRGVDNHPIRLHQEGMSGAGPVHGFYGPADEVFLNPILKSSRIHAERLVNNVNGSVDIFVRM